MQQKTTRRHKKGEKGKKRMPSQSAFGTPTVKKEVDKKKDRHTIDRAFARLKEPLRLKLSKRAPGPNLTLSVIPFSSLLSYEWGPTQEGCSSR